jgi:methionine-S-sulfoxide reductase
MDGVLDVVSGYANSNIDNPSYSEVKKHLTTSVEAIKIFYDSSIVNLQLIFSYLFKIIDVTAIDHQGGDYGHQYRSGIYYWEEKEKVIALSMIQELQSNYKDKIAIEVLPLKNFFLAEDYHQDYLFKNPNGYCHVNLLQLEEKHKKVEKNALFKEVIMNLQALLDGSLPQVTNLANACALLKEKIPYFSWVGFYLLGEQYLYLGPFQGKPACLKIDFNKGVCGESFSKKETIIVHDVHACSHHIACDSETNSEIVVPMLNKNDEIIGVLDVDSYRLGAFDNDDRNGLETIVSILKEVLH